jgi:adenylosuccinate synthase
MPATDTRTAAELEAAFIAGDTTITPAQIDKARTAERHAALQDEAERAAAARAYEAQREADREAFLAEYEAFVTTDLAPLREAYEVAVLAMADLKALTDERIAAQNVMMNRARALGYDVRNGTNGPVPSDAARWSASHVGKTVLDDARQEAEHGYVSRNGAKAITHSLHTESRAADMDAIRTAGQARLTVARERLDAARLGDEAK